MEKISAKKWLVKWVGITNYKILEKLLDLKFHEFADEISLNGSGQELNEQVCLENLFLKKNLDISMVEAKPCY